MNKHTPNSLYKGDQLRVSVRILRALAHPLRMSIIKVIHDKDGGANVGEIFSALKIEQSIASQHLRVLRQAGLVKTRRDRKFIYYTLDYERIIRASNAIEVLKT
ncbi:MAG: ArsR/SmtB family transcription factor [Saprospiraceae bacterium]